MAQVAHTNDTTDYEFIFFVSLILITIVAIAFVLYGLPMLRWALGITSNPQEEFTKQSVQISDPPTTQAKLAKALRVGRR